MIKKLTKAQEKKLSEYRDRYIEIGLCCDPVDKKSAIEWAGKFYSDFLGKEKPEATIVMSSPLSAWLAVCLLSKGNVVDQVVAQVRDQVRDQVVAQVRDQVVAQVGAQVGDQVWDQVVAQVWDQVVAQVRDQVVAQVRDQVVAQVGAQVGDQVWDQVGDQVWDQVWDQVVAQVRDQVVAQVRDQVRAQVGDFSWPYVDGHWTANYFSFYDYMQEVIGIQLCKKYNLYRDSVNFGLVYPLERFCVISDRPRKIIRNQNGLHCESGPAVLYYDGFAVYSLNGVRLRKEIVETAHDKIPLDWIWREENAEIRRELVRKVGVERIVKESGAVCLDKSDNGVYELLMVNLGDGLIWPYLKMRNPSIGTWHLEAVDKECKTVEQARQFRRSRLPHPELEPETLT